MESALRQYPVEGKRLERLWNTREMDRHNSHLEYVPQIYASTNAFACFKDLLGDTTPRTKGVAHGNGVKAGDSSATDPNSEFFTPFWSFRGRSSVGNGLNIDIR